MTNHSTSASGRQMTGTIAILLLCRFLRLICSTMPFSTNYLLGTLAAAAFQTLLLLPLMLKPVFQLRSPIWRWGYALFALAAASHLLSRIYALLQNLQAAYPMASVILCIAAAAYGLTLSKRATGRAAILLLGILAAGLLIQILSALPHANPLLLYTPNTAYQDGDAFAEGFLQGAELALLPLCCLPYANAVQKRRSLMGKWLIGQLTLTLPVILLGILHNSRLLHWKGNPFFLLLARTQMFQAVHSDGFWQLLLMACSVVCVTFFLQIIWSPLPESHPTPILSLLTGALLFGVTILFIMGNPPMIYQILVILLFGFVIPLIFFRSDKRSAERNST